MGKLAITDLLPSVLIAVIKLEPDEADWYELNGAAPELAANFTIPSKGPIGTLSVSCNHCWVVHHLNTSMQ